MPLDLAGSLSPLRAPGLREEIWYKTGRVLEKFAGARFQRWIVVAQPVPAAPLNIRPSTSITLGEVAPSSPLCEKMPRPAAVIAARFTAGARCWAAERNGELLGMIWLQEREYDEDVVRCRFVLAGPCAWDFDVWIAPSHRGGRLFAHLWNQANEHMKSRGIAWSVSRIASTNQASIAAHGRLGARMLCHASFLSLGPLQLAWFSGPPRLHLSWRDNDKPLVILRLPSAAPLPTGS